MQNLFLIDGASGVGKSDLLKWTMENHTHSVCSVRKATTRTERGYERDDQDILLDLEFLDNAEFEDRKLDYIYSYGGARYGFSRKSLTASLVTHDNVFIIVRSTQLIEKVSRDFHFVNVVPMFIYTDRSELVDRLKRKGSTSEDIAFRVARSEIALKDYYTHPEFYKEVIINNSSQDIFHATLERIIEKYLKTPKVNPHVVSVMMSFNPDNRKLDDYFDAMESAVKQVSPHLRCNRVDKAPGSPKISNEFREVAIGSRLVIVDLTENKQNVYYELGFLHGIGKQCIITAEEGTRPFFYPAEYKIIFYRSARELREKLQRALSEVLAVTLSI